MSGSFTRGAMAAALASVALPALALPSHEYLIRLDAELRGFDVDIRTSAAAAAIARLENRENRQVFCSVGFYHGLDLRRRTTQPLAPGEARLFTYPVRQMVGSVPVEVVCDARRDTLPREYSS